MNYLYSEKYLLTHRDKRSYRLNNLIFKITFKKIKKKIQFSFGHNLTIITTILLITFNPLL